MKRIFPLFVAFLMLVAPAYAYITATISDPEITLLPGESAELTLTIDSNENYTAGILCLIEKYDSNGTFIGNVSDDATGCIGGSGVTIEFTDGDRRHQNQSGDTVHTFIVSLDESVEPGYTYRYSIGGKNSYSVGGVTADVDVVPEFGTITAALALGGAGLTYLRLKRKQL